jgi:hypothetical protein
MPSGTRVSKCVKDLTAKGMKKGSAIPICTKSTGQVYQSGKPSKTFKKGGVKRKKKG